VREIPLNQIKTSSLNPRKDLDPDKIGDMIDSVRAQGVRDDGYL